MSKGLFVPVIGTGPTQLDFWEPVIFRRAEIEAEIDRLVALTGSDGTPRESLFIHPRSTHLGAGLTPGIRVTLSVLLPGESSRCVRSNSTQVNFCLRGAGRATIGGREVEFSEHDVWTTPSYQPYVHHNTTDDVQVRITYSNAPVLEKLHVHLVEDVTPSLEDPAEAVAPDEVEAVAENPFGTFPLEDGSTMLMSYEQLVNPETAKSEVLHWRWVEVRRHLDRLEALGKEYVGRRLYLLYNPATGRTNGTTRSFFATMTLRPPGIVDRPHRHISAAINYFMTGRGWSRVGGRRYEWAAGDLMFTAPGWMIHNHASADDGPVYELTIQDQPFHLANESLLWQEDLKRPARLLGIEHGFATNRAGE